MHNFNGSWLVLSVPKRKRSFLILVVRVTNFSELVISETTIMATGTQSDYLAYVQRCMVTIKGKQDYCQHTCTCSF